MTEEKTVHPKGKILVDTNPLANPNSYKSEAQIRAADKKEEAAIEAINPPLPAGFNDDDVRVGNTAFFNAADDLGKFQIYGGGDITVSGSGDTWVISTEGPEDFDEQGNPIPDSSSDPWTVTLNTNVTTEATIFEGIIYDGLHSVTKVTPTLNVDTVLADSLVCLEYTYDGGTVQSIIVAEGDYEPFTDDGEDPPVILTSVQHIAKIVEVDGELTVEQVSRNNFALTYACVNGRTLKRFTAL